MQPDKLVATEMHKINGDKEPIKADLFIGDESRFAGVFFQTQTQ
jgi:hypothetical protein